MVSGIMIRLSPLALLALFACSAPERGRLTRPRLPSLANSDKIVDARWREFGSRGKTIPLYYTTAMTNGWHDCKVGCPCAAVAPIGGDVHSLTWSADGFLYGFNDDPKYSPNPNENIHLEIYKYTGSEFDAISSPGSPQPIDSPPCDPSLLVPQMTAQIQGAQNPLRSADSRSFYSTGITSTHQVFYLTNSRRYDDGDVYNNPGGIAYSTDRGVRWTVVPAPPAAPGWMQSIAFVEEGQDSPGSSRRDNLTPEGFKYVIAHDREFFGNNIYVGRVTPRRESPAFAANLANYEWWNGNEYVAEPAAAAPLAIAKQANYPNETWHQQILYPNVTWNDAAQRYLLTFARLRHTLDETGLVPSWCAGHEDCRWTSQGSRLTILEAPRPEGPFKMVAQDDDGAAGSMKYSIQVLTKEQGSLEHCSAELCWQQVWVTFSGDYGRCFAPECPGTDRYGGYGTNFRQLQLAIAPGVP